MRHHKQTREAKYLSAVVAVGLALLALVVALGFVSWATGAETLALPQLPNLHPTFRAMVDATNRERQTRGYAPLVVDPKLQGMAETWGRHMAKVGRMYHSSYGVGENVAWGQETASEVVNDWMNSSGHRRNILGGYSKIGCAGYVGSGGRCYWVQCFSR